MDQTEVNEVQIHLLQENTFFRKDEASSNTFNDNNSCSLDCLFNLFNLFDSIGYDDDDISGGKNQGLSFYYCMIVIVTMAVVVLDEENWTQKRLDCCIRANLKTCDFEYAPTPEMLE